MLKCSRKRFFQEPRGVESWERMRKRIAKKDEESGVVEECGEGKHGPVFTTGQLFLHSWRHFLGLHLSELTIAILVNRSDIAPALFSSPPTSSNLLTNRPKSKIPHDALPRSRLYLFFDSYFWRTLSLELETPLGLRRARSKSLKDCRSERGRATQHEHELPKRLTLTMQDEKP